MTKKESNIPLKKEAVRFFGDFVDKNKDKFKSLKKPFSGAGIGVLFRTYISLMLLYSAIGFGVSFLLSLIVFIVLLAGAGDIVLGLFFIPLLFAGVIFGLMYVQRIITDIISKKRLLCIKDKCLFLL